MRTTFASLSLACMLAACGGTNHNEPLANCGPAPGGTTIPANDAANGTTVTAKAGDALAITLGDHGDGGYTWSVTNDGGFGTSSESHLAGSGAAGDFGSDVFTFGPLSGAGSHTVTLVDARSDGEQAGTYTLTVVIASDTTTQSVTIDDTQDGKSVDVPRGELIVVHLASLGDSGYEWSFVDAGTLGTPAQTHEEGTSGQAGDFGYDDFTFTTAGAAPGTYVIKLSDARSWDPSSAMPYSVTVSIE